VPREVLRSSSAFIPAYKSSESAMLRYRGRFQEMGQKIVTRGAVVVACTQARLFVRPVGNHWIDGLFDHFYH
jgi:hypothetical protein